MRYNLKNRPNCEECSINCMAKSDNIKEWFEGFEKELREKIKWFKAYEAGNLCQLLIKEILGE